MGREGFSVATDSSGLDPTVAPQQEEELCLCRTPERVIKSSSLPRQYGVWPSDLIFEGWNISGDQWSARAEDKEALVTKRRPQRKGKCSVAPGTV